MNHPGVAAGYSLNTSAGSIAYLPDNEPFVRMKTQRSGPPPSVEELDFARAEDEKLVRFIRGVEVLVLDSQYDAREYRDHIGWGHGCVDDAVEPAARGGQKLFLPPRSRHDDEKIDVDARRRPQLARNLGSGLEEAAQEGRRLN
jgi:hypothetical protein